MPRRILYKREVNPSRFALHAGAFFKRISAETIEIWRRASCAQCERPISLGAFAVPCDNDKEPIDAGLLRVVKGDKPTPGYYPTTHSMPVCGLCGVTR